MIGKFDALCFFLILLAAAPHFSRGGGCCRNQFVDTEHDTVLECIRVGERSEANVTEVSVHGDCNFGNLGSSVIIRKGIVISGVKNPRDVSALKDVLTTDPYYTVTFRRFQEVKLVNITFRYLTLSGDVNSTIEMLPYDVKELSASFSDCRFQHSVKIVFPYATDVNMSTNEFFSTSDAPTMLEIREGALHGFDLRTFCDKCSTPVINMTVCRDSSLDFFSVGHYSKSPTPAIIFRSCGRPLEKAPTVTMGMSGLFGATSNGRAYMHVVGNSRNGPALKVRADMASSGWASAQTAKAFRFIGVIPLTRSNQKSNFTLAKYEVPYGYTGDGAYLAETVCVYEGDKEPEPKQYNSSKLPIGPQSGDSMRYEMCSSYCCYVEKSGVKAFETNIQDCLKAAEGPNVYVAGDCPYGKPLNESLTSPVEIAKADSFEEDRVAITLEEGANYFVNDNDHQIVFTNIHFKKATGAADGVATVNQEDVTFTNCIFDDDVAKTPPSRVSNGTRFLR